MSKVSRENAPDVTDYGPAEDRGAHLDGYAVVFSSRSSSRATRSTCRRDMFPRRWQERSS
jgi:hypothetical protein